MTRLAHLVGTGRFQVWFNGIFVVCWLMAMPVIAFDPRIGNKVWVVTQLSLWALVATHLGAWIAALVHVRAERIESERVAELHFAHIEAAEKRLAKRIDDIHQIVTHQSRYYVTTLEPAAAPARRRKAPTKKPI